MTPFCNYGHNSAKTLCSALGRKGIPKEVLLIRALLIMMDRSCSDHHELEDNIILKFDCLNDKINFFISFQMT